MLRYLARRLLQFIPVLILASIVVFLLIRLIPGDPVTVMLGPTAKPEQIAQIRVEMGLDQPIWTQYMLWVAQFIKGDFGKSFINDFPVSTLLLRRLPATFELAITAILVALLISIPLGIIAAVEHGRWPDLLVTLYTSAALGIPDFWLGILLVLVFALKLNVLPSSGYVPVFEDPINGLKYLILPVITLTSYISAVFTRFTKASLLEVLHQDYIRTAYSKGLSVRQVMFRHAFKNALIPMVTVFALQLGGLLGGVVIIESIFDWPGLGRLLVQSIQERDYQVVQAIILLSVVFYLAVNLCADLAYSLIDPRIRSYGAKSRS